MVLETRLVVLPCGKCEDMMDCDLCIFQKEAKELYQQIREGAIDECIKALDEYIEFPMTDEYVIKECIRVLEKLKEQIK